jgi:hypothetical protein
VCVERFENEILEIFKFLMYTEKITGRNVIATSISTEGLSV